MKTLDSILNLLADGERHNINEVKHKVSLSDEKLWMALNFLGQYDFITLYKQVSGGEVIVEAKLTPQVHQFMKEIRWIERAELVSKP